MTTKELDFNANREKIKSYRHAKCCMFCKHLDHATRRNQMVVLCRKHNFKTIDAMTCESFKMVELEDMKP